MFTGEEQGLLGSLAYVKQHASEMKNHLACIVLDDGQGPVKEFQLGGRNDLIDSMKAFADSLANIREIPVNDKREFGTDTGPFILAGLPGINLEQDSPEYKYTHHSAADSLEEVKPEVLTQDATIMALTAFWIADRPERFASPWTPEQTAKMLRQKGDYDMLKSFNLWTFGNLGLDSQPHFQLMNYQRLFRWRVGGCTTYRCFACGVFALCLGLSSSPMGHFSLFHTFSL